jgi:hypothetical protein
MDTSVGGARSPALGATSINILNNDRSVDADVATFVAGDWLAVGHPTEGEVFRVESATDSVVRLTVDYTPEGASLSFESL